MNTSPIMELFFYDPDSTLYPREIARRTDMHPNTVLKEIKILSRQELIKITPTKIILEVRANKESEKFIRSKRIRNLSAIYDSGLIDYLYEQYNAPEAIILYGSFSRGEDIPRSDIDIAVITTREQHIDLRLFERKLKHNVQILAGDLKGAGKTFITNIANGIVLKGYLEIR